MHLWTPTPLNLAHVVVNMRPEDRREIFATRWNDSAVDLVNDCLGCGPFAWVAGLDEPIAVIGAGPLHPGVWSVYMFATSVFAKIAKSLTRHARDVMIPALVSAGAHRAECRSIEGHATAHRWLEWLGARHEADLAGYGRNGEDFRLYVWTRTDVLQRAQGQ